MKETMLSPENPEKPFRQSAFGIFLLRDESHACSSTAAMRRDFDQQQRDDLSAGFPVILAKFIHGCDEALRVRFRCKGSTFTKRFLHMMIKSINEGYNMELIESLYFKVV